MNPILNKFIIKGLLMQIKNSLFLRVTLITLFSLFHCNLSQPELRFGSNIWPGYEPFFLAKELNFFQSQPVHLVEFTSTSQVMRAFRNKVINAAGLTLDEAFLLKESLLHPKVVLILDISNGADILIAKPYIKNIKDLRGKKIGVENTALGAFFLSRILEKANLDFSDVKIITLEIQEQESAFRKNKIDAVVTFYNFKQKFENGIIIFDSTQIPEEIVDVLVIERDFLYANRPLVKNFIKTWFLALGKIQSEKDLSTQIMSDREKISKENFIETINYLSIPNIEENFTLLHNRESNFYRSAERLRLYLQEKSIVKRNTDWDGLIDPSLVEEIHAEIYK